MDQIRVLFEYQSGLEIEISEDMTGFTELMDSLPKHIPGFPRLDQWRPKIVHPPLATNLTTLWQKPD